MEKTSFDGKPGSARRGRPRTDSQLFTFRAPGTLARVISAHDNKTDFILSCIEKNGAGRTGETLRAVNAAVVKDVALPFFDLAVVAGFPVPLDNDERSQDIELLRMLCPNPESCYLIRVQGNSMIDADIHSGDLVIVDKSNRTPSEHEVAMCELNGEYTLKRFVKEGNEGWLVPANPDYPRIRVTKDDAFCIWGTVSYVIHKPR